jgi:hypothetical protein
LGKILLMEPAMTRIGAAKISIRYQLQPVGRFLT